MILQRSAGFCHEALPITALWQFDVALIRHLQEQQIGKLLDVIAVINSIVAKRVTETPELLDYIAHNATASLNWVISCGSCPAKTLLARPQPPIRLNTGKASKSLESIVRFSAKCPSIRSSHCTCSGVKFLPDVIFAMASLT